MIRFCFIGPLKRPAASLSRKKRRPGGGFHLERNGATFIGYPRDTGVDAIREVGMGWRPRIAQRKWKTLHSRSALTAPALNYSVSAPPLQLHSGPPPPFLLPAFAPQDERRGGKWGGRRGRGGYNRLPGGSTQQKEFHVNAPLYWATARRHLSRKQKRRFIDPRCDR